MYIYFFEYFLQYIYFFEYFFETFCHSEPIYNNVSFLAVFFHNPVYHKRLFNRTNEASYVTCHGSCVTYYLPCLLLRYGAGPQLDITTYRLNRPRHCFSEKWPVHCFKMFEKLQKVFKNLTPLGCQY